jgi:hypothetical protein
MKRIIRGTSKHLLTAAIVFSSVMMASNHASAFGLGDITRPLIKETKKFDPTVAGSKTSPLKKYKIVIRNPNKKGIHYRFDGKPDLLGAEKKTTWTVKNTSSTIKVSFDNGRRQTVRYEVGKGTYVFKWKNGVLDLFKD